MTLKCLWFGFNAFMPYEGEYKVSVNEGRKNESALDGQRREW